MDSSSDNFLCFST